jgi:hypothetical protein
VRAYNQRAGSFKRLLHLQMVSMAVPGPVASTKDVSAVTSPSLAEVPWTSVVVGVVPWRLRGSGACNQSEYVTKTPLWSLHFRGGSVLFGSVTKRGGR